jgi:hypothetical protein
MRVFVSPPFPRSWAMARSGWSRSMSTPRPTKKQAMPQVEQALVEAWASVFPETVKRSIEEPQKNTVDVCRQSTPNRAFWSPFSRDELELEITPDMLRFDRKEGRFGGAGRDRTDA